MTLITDISTQDKEFLKLVPFWVFYLVSNIEYNLEHKAVSEFRTEIADFTTELISNSEFSSQKNDIEITLAILESFNANFIKLHKKLDSYSSDYLQNIAKAGDILELNFGRREAQLFKEIMLLLAKRVSPRVKGWNFLKNNIKMEQAQTLKNLKKSIRFRESFSISV